MMESLGTLLWDTVWTIIALAFYGFIRRKVLHSVTDTLYKQPRHAHVVRHLLHVVLVSLLAIILVIIWFGDHFQNIWVTLTSIIGVLAIGFFAVWSVLSNIVCGAILMLLRNIEVGDDITMLEPTVCGRIEDINLFYVILSSKKGTYHIPNNMFIQKVVFKHN